MKDDKQHANTTATRKTHVDRQSRPPQDPPCLQQPPRPQSPRHLRAKEIYDITP